MKHIWNHILESEYWTWTWVTDEMHLRSHKCGQYSSHSKHDGNACLHSERLGRTKLKTKYTEWSQFGMFVVGFWRFCMVLQCWRRMTQDWKKHVINKKNETHWILKIPLWIPGVGWGPQFLAKNLNWSQGSFHMYAYVCICMYMYVYVCICMYMYVCA